MSVKAQDEDAHTDLRRSGGKGTGGEGGSFRDGGKINIEMRSPRVFSARVMFS